MAGRRIVRFSDTPYYEQLAEIIRAQIRAGEIEAVQVEDEPEPVQKMPSEKDLMGEYGLSRATVRKTLEVLRDTGWIETRHRRGSRVRRDWPQD